MPHLSKIVCLRQSCLPQTNFQYLVAWVTSVTCIKHDALAKFVMPCIYFSLASIHVIIGSCYNYISIHGLMLLRPPRKLESGNKVIWDKMTGDKMTIRQSDRGQSDWWPKILPGTKCPRDKVNKMTGSKWPVTNCRATVFCTAHVRAATQSSLVKEGVCELKAI
jgi:hypothetical protein